MTGLTERTEEARRIAREARPPLDVAAIIRAHHERGYRDPDGATLLNDPLERAACIEALVKWNGPEAATAYMSGHAGRDALEYWRRLEPADRQLYRKRAAAIVGPFA